MARIKYYNSESGQWEYADQLLLNYMGDPTDEQVAEAVDTWLVEHPEATTTVEDGSITPEKTSFITSPTEEAEDIVLQCIVDFDWGVQPSEPMYVENVDFLYVVNSNSGVDCFLGDYTDSVWTETGKPTVVSLNKGQYNAENHVVYVMNGYTGYIKFNRAPYMIHIYKNAVPPVVYPSMIDPGLYIQGMNAHYLLKPKRQETTDGRLNTFVFYIAESTEEVVRCYSRKGNSNTQVSIYGENFTLVETIKGGNVNDISVSGGLYYAYWPATPSGFTNEDMDYIFIGKEEHYHYWVLNDYKYGWFYTLPDTQVEQVINSDQMETHLEEIKRSYSLEPRFTFIGELWGKNLGKYQAWGFNDLKWDVNKKRMIMLMHDANGHGDGNCTQCYLKEINPYTFEYTDLPRIQVNGANIASYGFEILDNGNYITLASYDGGMRILTSVDGGQTYTAGDIIQSLTDIGMYAGTYHPFALMKLSNGRLFISCDTAKNELLYSDDSGATWQIATIPMGDITYTMTEADLTELDNEGTVIMLARSSRAVDKNGTDLAEAIFSISYDYGTTWETAQLSEIRSNCSDATALVHDGIVEVFACNKYCPVGGALNRIQALVDATGYQGDIRRYYATIEEAKQNIWHYAGIMGFANTTNPGYDMGSPCCCMTPNGDIWVGFYDVADDTTSASTLYKWFVAHKNGAYNFAKGIQELAMRLNA